MTAALPQPEIFFPLPSPPPSACQTISGTQAYLAENSPLALPPLVAHQLPGLPIGNPHIALEMAADVRPTYFRSRSTGKERDSESGLDYFGARYYGSALGRFTSPDEVFADQHPEDPQSWNLYSYVRNNPLAYVDRTGKELTLASDAKQDKKDYAKAVKYISKDAGEKGILKTLRDSDTTYSVDIIHDGNDRFDPNTNTIYWDPAVRISHR